MCRLALITRQPLSELMALDVDVLATMFEAHADIVDEEKDR
jgi:hypothetical protein